MFKQIKPFVKSKGGTKPGFCLQNVRLGFGVAGKYPNAIGSWNNSPQHRNRDIPTGIDVPLYYTYKSDGHINVRLANGQIWNDGAIIANLDTYIKTHPSVSYQGWGEEVNDVAVIQYVPGPPKPTNNMPAVGSKIQLIPTDTRNTFRAGTTTKAGTIRVTDNSFIYTVRGYDSKYPGRVLINSASAGGDNVALALYFTNGVKIPGWKTV